MLHQRHCVCTHVAWPGDRKCSSGWNSYPHGPSG